MLLKDKVTLITGAGGGIGRASALKFALEGAKVVAVDIQKDSNDETVNLVRSRDGAATGIQADVTDPQSVRLMMRDALEAYGRLDILWNHAGIAGRGKILDIDEERFDRVFNLNVKGIYLGCKEAIPIMKSQGGGVILNTASIYGVVGGEAMVVYTATKGAVVQMTRCLALDHAADGIRVNCICPGPIDTENSRRLRETAGDPESVLKYRLDRIPMGRLGEPREIADAAAFLCSDEASFITGAAILADGGWTAR